MISGMGRIDGLGDAACRHRPAAGGRRRQGLITVALAVAMAGCGGGDGDVNAGSTTAPPTSTESTATTATTGPATTTRPATTSRSATSSSSPPTTIRVVSTVLVGVVVGGNSGGIDEGGTEALSETVRTRDGLCRGWFGKDPAPEPWTASLRQDATVRVLDDKGTLLGTGKLGTGRPRQVRAGADADEHWQCEFEFSIDSVVQASAYHLEVGDMPRVRAEANPQRAGAFVVPVLTPLDPALVEACNQDLPQTVDGWRPAADRYWAQAYAELCNAGLRIGVVNRRCRPADVATLYVLSVVAKDGTVLEDRTSDGPTIVPGTLRPGTQVDLNVTTAVPCR